MANRSLATVVRDAIRRDNRSLTRLARDAEVSQSMVSRFAGGRRGVTIETMDRLIGTLGLESVRNRGWNPAAVGGLTMGADPVAYAIARASLDSPPIIDGFSVRKATKEHGTKRRVEGNFELGVAVVIVEDVMTSGGSAIQAVEAVRAEGGLVLGVLAVVDRDQGGIAAVERIGVEVACITTISRLGGIAKR